jgi:hypothetical protein
MTLRDKAKPVPGQTREIALFFEEIREKTDLWLTRAVIRYRARKEGRVAYWNLYFAR